MRILAIRGCNLASLAGEFEIDLAHGPLGAAGVFAIVGNTGAGKSTLLDALCVALFDRTPRLTNHSRVTIGRGDEDPGALGAQDVRTLLRRGAAAGWAEVDFESGDSRRYRARWSVRRARGHTDGTIQAQQVSLTTLDGGERLGGTKTETLQAIHERLGLSFDQFRRSALLAQGEFAAFLRADGKDRSELLERMTGTEIYTRLSMHAHARATLAEQKLREGRAAALAIAVLDDEARQVVEAELVVADRAKAAARARLAAAEMAARWVAEAARHDDALRAARAAHAAAVDAVAGAQADRTELALRRRAETLRGPWDDAMRLDRQHAVARGEVAAAGQAATAAASHHAAITARRAALGELHEPIRAARIAAGIVERVATGDGAEGHARAAVEHAVWLARQRALGPEIAAWSELDAKYAQHAATGDAIHALDRTLREHDESRGKLVAGRAALVVEHQAAASKLGDAHRKAEAFHKRRGLSPDDARKQEDAARLRLTDAERLASIAAGAREAIQASTELAHQLAALAALGATERAHKTALEAARREAAVVRTERARMVEELRRAAGYEHARAELREGEACPLCGAEDHPWADRGAFDDVIAAAEAKLAEVVSALDAGTSELASLTARADQREREQTRLEKLRAIAVASATGAVTTWREHLAGLGELLLVEDPSTPGAEALANERAAAAKKQLEAARDMRRQTDAAMKAVAEAQAEVQTCQASVDQMTARRAELDRRLAELDTTVERLKGERAGRAERHAELAVQLEGAIARWTAAAPQAAPLGPARGRKRDPVTSSYDHYRAWMAELATAWRARADRVAHADAALTAALATIDRDARAAERAAAEHATRLAEAERRCADLAAALGAAVAQLDLARAGSGFELEELRGLLSSDPSRLELLAEALAVLDRAVATAVAVVTERRRLVDDHALTRPVELEDAANVAARSAAVADADHHAASIHAALVADTDSRGRRAEALARLAVTEGEAHVDQVLGEVIGSHDGKLFRSFAQSLTLDGLLAVANAHLEELAPRYQLERVPHHDLELQVIDRDLGEEVRSVQSLSGGESFLVSLALALGLSSMSAHDVRVRTLLIDEGFGTLDPATLESALSVLDALKSGGRQVGVISHVPQLVERVGAHVRVVQRGGGRSEVIVA